MENNFDIIFLFSFHFELMWVQLPQVHKKNIR